MRSLDRKKLIMYLCFSFAALFLLIASLAFIWKNLHTDFDLNRRDAGIEIRSGENWLFAKNSYSGLIPAGDKSLFVKNTAGAPLTLFLFFSAPCEMEGTRLEAYSPYSLVLSDGEEKVLSSSFPVAASIGFYTSAGYSCVFDGHPFCLPKRSLPPEAILSSPHPWIWSHSSLLVRIAFLVIFPIPRSILPPRRWVLLSSLPMCGIML